MGRAGEQVDSEATAADGRSVWPRRLAWLVAILAVALLAAWLQRRTIARTFIDQALAQRGVPARYTLEQLSPWRQRLTNVVMGDPRNPDFVADWIELRTAVVPWRADLLVARVGPARLHVRIADGKVSLGAIDKLLPASGGGGVSLPHIGVALADLRVALDSPQGPVAIRIAGKGPLDNGFSGRIGIVAPRLASGGCTLAALQGTLDLRIRARRPAFVGPIGAAKVECGATRMTDVQATVAAQLTATLDRGIGSLAARAARLDDPRGSARKVDARVAFDGGPDAAGGRFALAAEQAVLPRLGGGAFAVAGDYRIDANGVTVSGEANGRQLHLASAPRQQLAAFATRAQATPLAPVLEQIVTAAGAATRDFSARAKFSAGWGPARVTATLAALDLHAATGARVGIGQGRGLQLDSARGLASFDGVVSTGGGGLPEALIRVRRGADGALRGVGFVRPYRAGPTEVALGRLDLHADPAGSGRLTTLARLSGDFSGGRVEGLQLPLAIAWTPTAMALNPECAQVRFDRLTAGSTRMGASVLRLCPDGGAMVRLAHGRLGGAVRMGATQLDGAVGASPLRLKIGAGRLDLARLHFAIDRLAVSLGSEAPTQLQAASIDGSLGGPLNGHFAGVEGQIGSVPLHLFDASGDWQQQAGALMLKASARVRDTAMTARFNPLTSDDVTLRLADGRIATQATLKLPRPAGAVEIARVAVTHDLAAGVGEARMTVSGIGFSLNGLQPSDITPLTFGVVADVAGRIDGTGTIRWTPEGVTSSGDFGTGGVDLAAAFGPVRGLATRLHFTDLLAMQTAPGQVATTTEINPGVPVGNGTVRFQLLDAKRIQVESATWPFAGGALTLDPTLLDFNEHVERHMRFRVAGANAAQFLKEMAFDNLDATGTFDGELPMIFDARGGRIEGGVLQARSGGSVAYVGEVSQRDLGFWGNMAFQALKSLDYRHLVIDMNGPLAGEMITQIRFDGVSQGKGTRSNFLLRRLARLPFVFNVRISAPFHQLMDSVQSWYDPRRLIERNLPALIEEERRARAAAAAAGQTDGAGPGRPVAVQPPESGHRP